MKFPAAALGLALLALTTLSAADEPKDPTQNDAIDTASKAITDFIIKPMSQELSDRMMRGFAENEGVMAPAAREYLKQRKIEEQIAYDEEMKRRHAAIVEAKRCKVDCKPRPIQECLKPDYTIDADVIGCSKGEITKSW
ncbi:hypothetical protein FBY21_4793 [Pseudomonas sp. SLBN-26]|uniref:hypothetical protein n=1 Tax=Pseudomonadaceae TaxID=135621 RepID=UPI00115312CF|nr:MULTISPECIES: hypothetical protein [Pseudomonas]MCP1620152.1 hypothetical protein [Pseudomonas otitidis]TQL09370.1 hypothetical protein FBY21_4793 [Pseudomonas sp. SLBN-26]